MTDDVSICTYSQLKIENMLESPTSAEFPVCLYGEYRKNENEEYYYSHYVDSQNGFWAMIRINFTCKVYDINQTQKTCKITCKAK